MLNDLLVKVVLSILGQILNKDTVAKFRAEIELWIKDALAALPGCSQHLDLLVCCKLRELAKSTSNSLDDAAVQLVANALGVDMSQCPEAAIATADH